MKKLIFFCFAAIILLLSIIVVNIAPAINGFVYTNSWMEASCTLFSDSRKITKNDNDLSHFKNSQEVKDNRIKSYNNAVNRCVRRKGMVGLEFACFNANVILSGLITLVGLWHYFNGGKLELGIKIKYFGICSGGLGFLLSFIYVIVSGIVFNDIAYNDSRIRINSNGAFVKWKDNKYSCIYYNKNTKHDTDKADKLKIRYSDYGSKILSYKKYLSFNDKDEKYHIYRKCNMRKIHNYYSTNYIDYPIINVTINSETILQFCSFIEKNVISQFEYDDDQGKKLGKCDYIYADNYYSAIGSDKTIYDRWVATLVLSCFIFLFNIGLSLFGYLLISESKNIIVSTSPVQIEPVIIK